jgi:hypothetical protein
LFGVIGIYWALMAENFLEWTTMSNIFFRKIIDHNFARPYLVQRSYATPSSLETDGRLNIFVWSLRFLGLILAFSAVFTFSFAIGIFI